ncbi:DUF6809 family protein [Anaeromassilibacillus senegalensis]|uniref:DUF6809 family protein n=1 Tax=Anaeromassilibacillus senegalensis TaxID=1673717 RepID=UPI00068354B8|nr:DUF6809 family protein [Anaeromassilibacillus senegalensis]
MKKILSDLYYGNLCPNERPFYATSAYNKAVKTLFECEDHLLTHLEEPLKDYMKRYQQAESQMQTITIEETYLDGFRTGARIMLEILTEESERTRSLVES